MNIILQGSLSGTSVTNQTLYLNTQSLIAINTLFVVRNPGLAGVLLVTVSCNDPAGPWSRVVANINLLSLAGTRVRDIFCDMAPNGVPVTVDMVFAGVLGYPQIDYYMGYV